MASSNAQQTTEPVLPLSTSKVKTFIVLENNPEVLTPLVHTLGLSPHLQFHDIYTLSDASLLTHIPRPAHALLAILPLTPSWAALRSREDSTMPNPYPGHSDSEPVIWFKQTIGHACGSIGALHCCINGSAAAYMQPGTTLAQIRHEAIGMDMEARAQMLYDNEAFEAAHKSVANLGDTLAPDAQTADRLGQHFVAFVKGKDGHLWELEGSRRGPIDRGLLEEDEDVLAPRAIEMGIGRYVKLEREEREGDLRFSCTALA